jgi:dolichyl-diphosphooligosaccharide---protein glycosyltransferase
MASLCASKILYHLVFGLARLLALIAICYAAYSVRMHAINIYGLVIHEFDPWFNFRATQYLADNGIEKFFHWFDYMSWSPLGRPVGTTIYPGMQLLSVGIWKLLNALNILTISLNDVCCYVPVWGGVTATLLLGATTYVATGSANAGVFASAVMSIIPAHIMRSVGGGFDNESVAISALCLTFLCWNASLSGSKPSYLGGILTGLAYICMVASWGGYVFVCNVIALHAFLLIFLGRYSDKLYWAYTLWYVIGTTGAMHVPVVGLTPLKSLEQMAPLGVFFFVQTLQFCELSWVQKLFGIMPTSGKITTFQRLKVRAVIFSLAGLIAAGVIYHLWPTGYFGPLSARVRGLFVQHTRTGNPLVDSVAEHQPANPEAFWQFLHYACHSSPLGYGLVVLQGVLLPLIRSKEKTQQSTGGRSTDPLIFILTYASVTYFFATKMNRLMLLMGPVSAMLSGVALGFMFDFVLNEIFQLSADVCSLFSKKEKRDSEQKEEEKEEEQQEKEQEEEVTITPPSPAVEEKGKKGGATANTLKKRKNNSASTSAESVVTNTTKEQNSTEKEKEKKKKSVKKLSATTADWIEEKLVYFYSLSLIRLVRLALAGAMVYIVYLDAPEFYKYSTEMAGHLSHPSIMFQARLRDGTEIMVDDYREAYWWLRDNTPEDSRVMAWWDYGYQITGIGNRTTIADGNTWNHEVSSALFSCSSSPVLPLTRSLSLSLCLSLSLSLSLSVSLCLSASYTAHCSPWSCINLPREARSCHRQAPR